MGVITQRWGRGYTLVTSDGVPLEDSPTTQGLAFWKSPRRKLYSILSSNRKAETTKRYRQASDSEDDFEPCSKPCSKQIKEDKLETLINEVGSIKENVLDMFSLNKNSNIPLGLKRVIRDTFQCTICCRVPIHSPVIVTKCCKTILGCETCVNAWYSGAEMLTKTCPSCRAERGCNETMVLRGLDDFLLQMAKVLETDETEEPN